MPTTPTTAAIVAGVQAQEALKLLHGQPTLSGAAFVFEGRSHTSYVTTFQRNPECLSHEPLGRVAATGRGTTGITAREVLSRVREALGPRAHLEFARELLGGFECPGCGAVEQVVRPLTSVTEAEAICPACGSRRAPRLFHALRGGEAVLDLTLAQLGVPAWDIVLGRCGEQVVGLELDGDRDAVLGQAATEFGRTEERQPA